MDKQDPSSTLPAAQARIHRIAIVSDNASLSRGGEAAMPIRFFRHFRALGVGVVLLTHDRVRRELEATLASGELAHVVLFADTWLQRALFAVGSRLPTRIKETYVDGLIRLLTERRQAVVLRGLAARGEIDLVLQPTPISPRAISLIDRIGVPVFFGPLNGAMDYPPAMRGVRRRLSDALILAGRWLSQPLHYVFTAKRHAAGLFVANPRTLRALPAAARTAPRLRSFDATIEAGDWQLVRRTRAALDAGHFIYVGRLVDWKAVDIAIRAAHLAGPGVTLSIVGDGPQRQRLEALAARGPARVEFLGFQSHGALVRLYGGVCAQLLPSLREAGANVCLEALASGVPVIATRWGGARDVVADGVDGLLIEPLGVDAMVEGFAYAMASLKNEPDRAWAMGLRGRARVGRAFAWDQKAADYLHAFESLVEGSHRSMVFDAHPSFGPRMRDNIAWGMRPTDDRR